MFVTRLSLTDFRNYRSAELELGPGPTLLVGQNGQGKTNLIESIGYLSTLGSHRVASDAALIRHGADSAVIRALLQHAGREVLLELQLNRSAPNRAQVGGSKSKPAELPRYCSSVMFAPEDLALVRGEPATRRRFLDELVALRSPRMIGVLADYDRVLRQRNTLLKTARSSGVREASMGTLDIWDERLVDLGAQIMTARSRLVIDLAPEVAAAYEMIAGTGHETRLTNLYSALEADPEADLQNAETIEDVTVTTAAEWLRTALRKARRAELERGLTLAGPHRDDLLLTLNSLAARAYASHGESWSLALSLKLASAQLLRRESAAGDPVLMLDDVFAELDARRRSRLADAARDFEQVLITAAVLEDVPDELRANTVHIQAGQIVQDSDDDRRDF